MKLRIAQNKPLITDIVFHHTAVSNTGNQFFSTERYHKNKWGKKSALGYYTGYNIFIDTNGSITQTRLVGEETIAQRGRNCSSEAHCNAISVCVTGDFTKDTLTAKQEVAVLEVIEIIKAEYPNVNYVNHKDVPGNVTACPGNLITQIQGLEPTQVEKKVAISSKNEYIAMLMQTLDILKRRLGILTEIKELNEKVEEIKKNTFHVYLDTKGDVDYKNHTEIAESFFKEKGFNVEIVLGSNYKGDLLRSPVVPKQEVEIDYKAVRNRYADKLLNYDVAGVITGGYSYEDGDRQLGGSSSRYPTIQITMPVDRASSDRVKNGVNYGSTLSTVIAHEIVHQLIDQYGLAGFNRSEHKRFHKAYNDGEFDEYVINLIKRING